MPFASPSNNWLVGIAKQSAEGTVSTTATYSFPVFSGRPQPVQSIARNEVTDAAAIVGDPYKQTSSWEAALVLPAYGRVLGTFLQGMWPTDTPSGGTHVFTGLGNTPPWVAFYSDPLGGALDETFRDGVVTGVTFSADGNGGPLRVGVNAIGKAPTVASWSAGTAESDTEGYFTVKGATLKYEVDNSTPATETNISDFAVSVIRDAAPVPTADAVSAALLNLGKITPDFTMNLVYDDWEAYRATFYGAAAGTVASTTIVEGSVEINAVHTVNAGWLFKLAIDSAVLAAAPPQPDPSGSALLVPIAGYATKPASGDHVKPTLINSWAGTY